MSRRAAGGISACPAPGAITAASSTNGWSRRGAKRSPAPPHPGELHAWEIRRHDHGPIGDEAKPHGNGVLLWFEVDDFDRAVARATELGAEVVLPPHRNPPDGEPGGPAHREIWLRDPDGYTVVLASPDCESPLEA